MLNGKMFQLIKLLNQQHHPLTSGMLAQQLKLSPRTCKRYIAELSPLMEEHGACILSDKTGYHLEVHDALLFEAFLREKTKVFEFSENSGELQFEILKNLLVHSTLSQNEMIDQLYISRSTLNKLMIEVKATLKENGIQLANRPYYGYYIAGNEIDIRNFMVKTLFVTASFLSAEPELLASMPFSLSQSTSQICQILKEEGIPPEEDLVHYCLKYLMVSLCRIHNGALIHLSIPHLSETLQPTVQRAASAILNLFCDQVLIRDEERLYFASIIGNRTQALQSEVLDSAVWLKELVEDMLNNILNLCKVDFRSDETLKKALMTHLYASFSRYYLKATLPNPLISLIKSQYVEAYNYSLIGCEMLKEKHQLAINDDDLGYIALHFAAALEKERPTILCRTIIVCGSGMGTSELIRLRLSRNIPQLAIQAVLASYELLDSPTLSADFIITTVPLSMTEIQLPAVLISPMVTASDIQKVEFMINNYTSLQYLRSLFRRELFFPDIPGNNKDEALNHLTDSMVVTGLISEAFATAIKEREAMSSTEITEKVAIPHCFLSVPIDTMLAVGILKEPVAWGTAHVQLVFVGIINPAVKKNKCVFPMIYRLIQDSDKVQRLIQQTQADDFLRILFESIETEL
ncbi:BglG family transcription antiterminator [Holdemania massiliensis]|uniref:BglG family transcription antiterminator n=1 Tax=Holdemania massiliensis TaxID=1468449 RepID=UPI001F053DEE|nr:BglG family transcription antiterminator [Holdemania massiliensis]MCH1940070.1 BglG family transcription antiterminator [Holdemania massiliensis]